MFIRRTQTRNRVSGEAYYTHRLVETIRVGKAVKQRTLLNLGSQFDVKQAEWPVLAARIEQLLRGQGSLLARGGGAGLGPPRAIDVVGHGRDLGAALRGTTAGASTRSGRAGTKGGHTDRF